MQLNQVKSRITEQGIQHAYNVELVLELLAENFRGVCLVCVEVL